MDVQNERRHDYVGISKELQKIQEENKKFDTEITSIKNDLMSLRNHLDNGWKNDLVAMVVKATLGINQTKTKGFWDWIKGAFTVAFFLGIFELIKFIMR
jgi:hypothetical protein